MFNQISKVSIQKYHCVHKEYTLLDFKMHCISPLKFPFLLVNTYI